MENHITNKAEEYVKVLMEKGLTEDHQYHDLSHTLSVRDASLVMGRKYQLDKKAMEILELAALFHDTGFTRQYDHHEDFSKEIASDFLQQQKYPVDKTKLVLDLIETTRVGIAPKTLMEKILKDADFNTYGKTYLQNAESLRHEWEVFRGHQMSYEEWVENNVDFWSGHEFYTGEALAMFGDEKRRALKKFKKQMKSKEGKDAKKKAGGLDFSLNSSKAAQMMFKTTLRNQIDLTNIADNKANIMLTINSGIVTLGMPLLASQMDDYPYLKYPFVVLLLTCILSIVFATLATRPAKMGGKTDLNKIDNGGTNLFFFGNFFKMPQTDYQQGLKQVVENDSLLDKTIVNDLYFLGLSLGRKYSRLHTTYSIFMVGMIITVIVYAVAFALAQ